MKNKNPILSREQINKVMSLYSQGKFEEAIVQIKVLNEIYPNVPLLSDHLHSRFRAPDAGRLTLSTRTQTRHSPFSSSIFACII